MIVSDMIVSSISRMLLCAMKYPSGSGRPPCVVTEKTVGDARAGAAARRRRPRVPAPASGGHSAIAAFAARSRILLCIMVRTSLPLRLTLAIAMVASAAALGDAALANEEAVDQRTELALGLDVHPQAGEAIFKSHCVTCHGPQAHGDPTRTIPALAGQRFNYLVRQLANFSGGERESTTMHRQMEQAAVQEPQSWVDIAGFLNRLPTNYTVQ